jgi:tricorn protease
MRRARLAVVAIHFLVPLLLLAHPTPVRAQGTRFLRQPSVGPDGIAFVHANDIWVVGRNGGLARRITSHDGAETGPAFSPDGRWIAFTAQYDGNTDVYVVDAQGGQPRRLTWHPGADVVQGWTPDGSVLFQSGRDGVPTRLWRFFTVPLAGGLPAPLPVHQAYLGEMSDDGAMLAYQEIGFWDPEWRNYRGGQAQPVRVVSLATLDLQTPPWQGERQMDPSWMEGSVFYLSERDWAANVWAYDPRTRQERQLTFHADFDVKSVDAGHGVVVYEQGGYLHELDPATGRTRRLEIHAAADQNWARSRWEDVTGAQLTNARLSPTGRRAIFEHRGELFTVPAESGSWRNVTRTPGVADRHPVWSPDGQRIAWFNDEGGEYGLVVADQEGANARRYAIPEPTFFFVPAWSPDGARIAFTDTDYRVLVLDLASGRVTHVDTDRYAHPERTMNPVWSPDSRWIAYAKRLDTQLRAVFVHDVRSGDTRQLTDGMADAITPVWDRSGKYLYFLASTNYGLNTGWLDMTSYERPVTRSLYVAILREGEPSPFLPKSDEEGESRPAGGGRGGAADQQAGAGRGGAGRGGAAGDSAQDAAPAVVIDFDGIARRIVDAPGLPARDYQGLVEGPEGRVFVLEPGQGGGQGGGGGGGSTLRRYTLEDREATEFMTGVNSAVASHDREKLLVRQGANWSIVGAGGGAPGNNAGRLTLTNLRVQVEPQAEWAQMLREGWRFMRDFLYVDNTHGAPWDDVWAWYSPWLAGVEHRADFNHLLDILSGEIGVGHSYVTGGDYPDLESPGTGLLGVDLEEVDGFYRIAKVYTGESWNPGLAGPLSLPGMDVDAGDWLVGIDGRELRAPTNPFTLLEGTAGRTIRVRVNDRPSLEGARELFVQPIASESQLRSWEWIEGNRRRVDEMSGGRLAYVYVPNTGQGGYTYFNRMYFAQQDKQGAVIDERNNGGGSAADYIVDVLARELTGYFNSRAGDHKPWTQPMAGVWGPKVMIINERAGSGGDLLPYLFRFREVGPLVGTRTWGGLVGTWDTPTLIDGGRFVAPRGGFFDVNGEWAVEAEGVAPDIEVMNDPKAVAAGRDPQLERAVDEALARLRANPVVLEPEPAPPVRYRRPEPRTTVGTGGGGR